MTTRFLTNFELKSNPYLPFPKPKKKPGRPRKDDKRILSGIFYLLRSGCQWKALPRFMELQAPFMIDFKNVKNQAYLKKCSDLVYWSTMIKKD